MFIENIKKHSWNWKEPIEKECSGCGKRYLTKKENKKYCTQPCWTSHNHHKDSEETKRKRVESNKKTVSTQEHKEKIKSSPRVIEARRQNSIRLKRLIKEGKFTPCITNSWTNWKSYIKIKDDIKKFRSNWEAVFFLLNQHLDYEKVRIQYEYQNKVSSYIVDFVDFDKKILYEIKPSKLKSDPKNIIKFKSALSWCKDNSYKMVIISDSWFKKNANMINYEEQPQLLKSMRQFLK